MVGTAFSVVDGRDRGKAHLSLAVGLSVDGAY